LHRAAIQGHPKSFVIVRPMDLEVSTIQLACTEVGHEIKTIGSWSPPIDINDRPAIQVLITLDFGHTISIKRSN